MKDGFITVQVDERTSVQTLDQMCRWMALSRTGLHWVAPVLGQQAADIPADTQVLSWQVQEGTYGLLPPLIDGDVIATAAGVSGGVRLEWPEQDASPGTATIAYCARGPDPYVLMTEAMKSVRDTLGTFRLRHEKEAPAFSSLFGGCTRDVFLPIGLFHVRQQDGSITNTLRAGDVPELKEKEVLSWYSRQRKATVVRRGEPQEIELDRANYEIVTFVPWVHGIAVIGLADAFVPAAGIVEVVPSEGESVSDCKMEGSLDSTRSRSRSRSRLTARRCRSPSPMV